MPGYSFLPFSFSGCAIARGPPPSFLSYRSAGLDPVPIAIVCWSTMLLNVKDLDILDIPRKLDMVKLFVS